MRVAEAMTRRVTSITPSTSALTALRLMHGQGIRHLPVVEDGALVGIVSDRDLTPATRTAPSAAVRDRRVRQLMAAPVRWMRPDDDLLTAVRQMLAWRISALPVLERERIVGILTTTDCLRALVGRSEVVG